MTNKRLRDLLADVIAAGGCVHVDEWRALYTRHGYISANGLFGTIAPSMKSSGDLRCITDIGRGRALRA